MKDVELVRLDPTIEESLTSDPVCPDAVVRKNWVQIADLLRQLVGRRLTTTPASVDKLEWGGYFVVDVDTREVVGSCGFKGEPTEDGTVETAYFTYPDYEGLGYATLMARKLIKLATESGAVKRVIAHTLPPESASSEYWRKCR